MLSTLKIVLLIIGIPTLPLAFIAGLPFLLVSLPCLFGAVAIDRYQANQRSGGIKTSSSKTTSNFVIIIFGIGLFFAINSVGSLGKIDTTGHASSDTTIGTIIFCVLLEISGLAFVNRKKD